MATFGGWAISLMMAILVLISFVCTFLLPETMGTSLTNTATSALRVASVSDSRSPMNWCRRRYIDCLSTDFISLRNTISAFPRDPSVQEGHFSNPEVRVSTLPKN